MPAEPFPEKYWVHTGGLVELRALGEVPVRAEELVDRAKIAEAFARFGIGHDEGRLDVILSCFTDDVSYETSAGGPEPATTMVGKAALAERLGANLPISFGQRRHCISNICVERLGPADATVLAYGIVPMAADGFTIKATVFYITEMRKCPDGFWRFSRFRIGMDDYAEDDRDRMHRD